MGWRGRAQIRIACPGPGRGPQTGSVAETATGSVAETAGGGGAVGGGQQARASSRWHCACNGWPRPRRWERGADREHLPTSGPGGGTGAR